ncbi:AraC family transcriptional regulator [Leptospira langatensis]|uniref:AraC family transcriptional regulator n=1 Tax=Leptospira langatensis TaxID=2484983 RepID=A0A5F1ZTM8_9LEPT|nr:helix-turn-helix domain-containing protein [Leptospira langatensis]TGK02842.1 AraC family transcriptional regulator [Leptospira langatensis]TGL41596.1 AraC family transcriptional regulator [Leptospira langatensis]
MLLSIGCLVRPEKSPSFKILSLLSFCVSIQFLSIFFLLREIYFEPLFLNHMHIPLAWFLGPGMFSLFSVTVRDEQMSWTEKSFYLPGVFFLIFFPLFYLAFPESFSSRPIDYFKLRTVSWLDVLLIGAYSANLIFYLSVVWQTRSVFRWQRLKEDAGARILLFVILGSGSATLVLVLAFLIRDLNLLFASVLGTVIYAVIGYLFQIHSPHVFQEIGPSMRDAYRNSRLDGVDTADLETRLDSLMKKERMYLQEDLSLGALSNQLDIKPYQLSEFLNQRKGMNFSKFVNGFRVAEAVRILEKEDGANILAVAYRSGFNSKATFNLAFKSVTGVSPREFLRKTKVS